MHPFPRIVITLALSSLLASCEVLQPLRQNKLLITAHVQTNEIEHRSSVMNVPIGDQQIKYRKIPEFSQRSISGFEPFPTDDIAKDGYGVLLQLDTKGRNALDLATRENRGMTILTMVQGTPVDMVEIDQPIADGRFTIWRGLTKKTIDEMDKFYPRLKYMNSNSTSRWMDDMLPSTAKEKLNSRRDAKAMEAAEKAAERYKARGKPAPPPKKRKDIIPLEDFKQPGT